MREIASSLEYELLAMTIKSMDEDIKKLLEENLAYSKEIYTMTRNIKRYITFQKVMSVIYLLLIVVPIILSIVFLPPLLKGVFDQYKDLLGVGTTASGSAGKIDLNNIDLNKIDINKLPANIKAMLNK